MYTKILVAVDGSPASDAALEKAVALSGQTRAALRIVHVVESPYAYPDLLSGEAMVDLSGLGQAWRDAGRRVLDRAVAVARKAGVEAEAALLEGEERVSGLIAEEARRAKADLIVVGTHGRRGLDRLLLGSVAEGVARSASTSVLLVRQPEPGARP
jgi:nucleotide-binding universal stress UspA family protein